MSLLGAVKKAGQASIEVGKLPLSLVIDSVTMGGALTDSESKTVKNVKKLARKADEAIEELYEDDE